MTENSQRYADENPGSGRDGGKPRPRRWIAALVLLGLGAAGGAVTTVALDAAAHDGWRHKMGAFRHHGHHRAPDAAHAAERLQHVSAWALDSVDATDEQRERIDAILASTVNDVFPLRDEHDANRRGLITELSRPQIERTALDRIRTAEIALAEQATARLLDATVAIAEVLEPAQRQQLIEKYLERRRRH